MIRILIADNEQEIRTEIRKLIEENIKFPFSIFEAKNGQEAMEFYQNESVNLLVTNIHMQLANGIQLLHLLQKNEHKSETIVIGESTEFETLKQVINYGAIDYILKPIDKEEFLIAISKAEKKISKANQLYNEIILRQSLLLGYADKKQKLQNSGLEKGMCCVAIWGTDCKKKINRQFKSFPFYILEEQKNFVLYVLPANIPETINIWESSWIKAIGISSIGQNLSQLRFLKNQAYCTIFQYFSSDNKQKKQKTFMYTNEMYIADYSDFDTLYERFIGRLEFLKSDEIALNLNNLFNLSSISEQKRGSALYYMYNKITQNLFKRFPGHVDTDDYLYSKQLAIENIWQTGNLNTWKDYIYDYLVYLATLLQNHTANYPFISDAIDYIKSHFTGSLNMAMVANHVSVNYTYFSEKFKEHTGINFNDYLKRIRIEEACRLLTEGFYKVYEVSTRSGFSDVKYFMRTFKELVGITPGEYRRSRNRNV